MKIAALGFSMWIVVVADDFECSRNKINLL